MPEYGISLMQSVLADVERLNEMVRQMINDGRVTTFDWNAAEESVHQHQLYALMFGTSVMHIPYPGSSNLEVDYERDLDDEIPFTEALAALERIRKVAQ